MATVVFDNGNSTGIWSDTANWVGDALPGTADVADINEDCILDMDAIVANLDIAAGKTLTMGSGGNPYDITGMTAAALGTGSISMLAGSELHWNSASGAHGPAALNITARGTSGARCVIAQNGSGGLTITGAILDCEYTSIRKCNSIVNATLFRVVDCDIEGRTGATITPGALSNIIENCWISTFASGLLLTNDSKSGSVLLVNVTFGTDIDGNSQPNTQDINIASNEGGFVTGYGVILGSTTKVTWASDNRAANRVVIDNFGRANGVGTAGIGWVDTPNWTIERSTAAKKTGDFGARVTPKAGVPVASDSYADISLYLPVSSGDDISVSVYGLRSQMTDDCAEIEIDPEGAWYAPVTGTATMTNEDEFYEFTATRTGAGGTGATGMVRIVLRVKEYEASNYFYWADFTATIGGVDYTVDFAEWSQGVPVASRVVTGGGGAFMPRQIQVGL